ncbi:MAG: class I SAM-dependent methyltransferase, partial [Rhodothermales bacterium]
MEPSSHIVHEKNRALQAKYRITARLYDFLDYPWERKYRRWRPGLLKEVRGTVLEAGVGTGRNLRYYHPSVALTAFDLSEAMVKRASIRAKAAVCTVDLCQDDATVMASIPSSHYDWLISTFLCCVMPDELQPLAIKQFERVLKPGGRFCLLEMQYPRAPLLRTVFKVFAPLVEAVYGARFDRNTLAYIQASSKLEVTNTYYLKKDVYLVIEGVR